MEHTARNNKSLWLLQTTQLAQTTPSTSQSPPLDRWMDLLVQFRPGGIHTRWKGEFRMYGGAAGS